MPTMPSSNSLQIRLSCDRCHSQKLRCQRQHGRGNCQRCAHLNAICVFSPRQARRTLATTKSDLSGAKTSTPAIPSIPSSVEPGVRVRDSGLGLLVEADTTLTPDSGVNDVMDTDLDIPTWLQAGSSTSSSLNRVSDLTSMLGINLHTDFIDDSFDFNFAPDLNIGLNMNPDPAPIETAATKMHMRAFRDNSIASGQGNEMVQYVRQLADLNVRLCEHMSMLPPLHTDGSTSPSQESRVPSVNGQLFPIDETFSLTQSLIDLLKHLYPQSGPTRSFVPDQATLLLIMSCSGRVFDIYEVIFGHMRGCVNDNITPVTSNGQTLVLPQLKIGAYAPPKPTAIAMQMFLIVMLASELFDQLREVLGGWQRSMTALKSSHLNTHSENRNIAVEIGTHYPSFPESTRLEMERRAQIVAGEIVGMRQMLMNIPGITGFGSV